MLVGDAAAFTDPFTGEGIYFALRGAELAAETAEAALKASDLSAESLGRYDRARRELRERYILCDLVQAVIRTPLLMNQAVSALACSPNLQDKLMRVLGDEEPPGSILNPGFAWSLFKPHCLRVTATG
jgi:flavin-dependent dehydrogenase